MTDVQEVVPDRFDEGIWAHMLPRARHVPD